MSTTHRRGYHCIPLLSVLHPHIHRMAVAHIAVNMYCTGTCCTLLRHLGLYTVHRKSRIVSMIEALHKSVDEYCEGRLSQIQKAKERHAYDLKCKACLLPSVVARTCMYMCASGCVCVCTCYVYCPLDPSHDRHVRVHAAMWCVHHRSLYHTSQADARKRASTEARAEAKAEVRRPVGRPRLEALDEVAAVIEAAAAEPGELDFGLFSQPGTPRGDSAPQPPLLRASTQVVARHVIHPCP